MDKPKKKTKNVVDEIFYTNNPLEVAPDMFASGVLEIAEPICNYVHTRLCTASRRIRCSEKKQCGMEEPNCEVDKASLLGLSYSGKKFQRMSWEEKNRRIEKILRERYEKCRAVRVLVEEKQ